MWYDSDASLLVDGSADQSMRFLTDALHQASFASPQRYTPSSVGYQTGPNVNQTFQLGPALPQTDRDVNTHRGSVSAAGNQFDSNGGASILQAARGVLETKLAFNSGQQHTMLPPLTTDEHMSLTAPPPSIDQQIYGSTVSQMEPSTHISASLWGLKQGNSRDDHVVGAAHQSAAPLRPWSTLPKNFGDASTKTRPGILDNGIFPAPELVPSNFPQNPTTSPVFQETSDNSPWGSIGDRRSNDKGSFASAFMPSSVTIRKKTSAPVLQSPLTGQMPVGFNPYQSQLSVSPEREYLPHPLQQQAGAQGLQSPYEVNETTTPNFSVDPHGSPRRSRFITSNTSPRRLGLQSFSLLRGASNSQSCEESCLHKEQVATLRNENEFLKRMLGQAEESMKLKSMDAAKKLEYYQTQMHLLTEESLRLQRVIAARDLAFKGTSSRTISPAKLERAATAPPAMSESFKKLTKQFTDEFLMLYRTLNCWSSRFLQFPNGDQVPQGLAEKLGEFLTSPELFGLILHEKTKQFAVSGFVARVFMKLIFVQDFVKKVADVFNAKQRNDPNFDATDDSVRRSLEMIRNKLICIARHLD